MPASDKMYRYAFSIVKDSHTASDVVQECLMKIWDKRKMLPDIKSPDSWAMRIVRNQCYDWVKMNRYTLLGDKEINTAASERTDDTTLLNDQQNWLDLVLASLPEKHQEIFHLREVEGLAYQEIAEILGLGLSEVKVNLHRTRAKIRESFLKLENYGVAN